MYGNLLSNYVEFSQEVIFIAINVGTLSSRFYSKVLSLQQKKRKWFTGMNIGWNVFVLLT